MKKIRKAVIPAAGYGTRLLPITKVVPKELLPIGNKPAIQYVVEEAVAAGVDEIILVCHPSKKEIVNYFRPDQKLNDFLKQKGKKEELEELERIELLAKFSVVFQEEPRGLGDAVLCAREAVGEESFLVMLPDVLISDQRALNTLLDHCRKDNEWGILLERVSADRLSNYGMIRGEKASDGNWRVLGAVEKPLPQEAPSDLAILGRYLFTPRIFDFLEGFRQEVQGELQLTDAIDRLAQVSPGYGVVCSGEVHDIGTVEGLMRAVGATGRSPLQTD